MMPDSTRKKYIDTIVAREKVRSLSRVLRLKHEPFRTLKYYFLAAIARILPFPKTSLLLTGDSIKGYLPECNTFYYYGYGEANLTSFFIRYVTEGKTILDIGSHIGSYAVLLARLTGETGHIYCFEPTPWTFKLLKHNTANFSNITLENRAVAEVKKTISFTDYGPGYGAYNSGHMAGADALSKKGKKITVEAITLDTYCATKNISPSIIKIDSEGFEYEVLQGSEQLLKYNPNKKRPLIIIEVANGAAWEDNRNQAFSLLKANNYLPYEIAVDGTVKPHQLKHSYQYDNLLFIPEESTDNQPYL
ncbi:MAG: FkbM family methyltransferase [Candidatus Paceibacterota bacterium]